MGNICLFDIEESENNQIIPLNSEHEDEHVTSFLNVTPKTLMAGSNKGTLYRMHLTASKPSRIAAMVKIASLE